LGLVGAPLGLVLAHTCLAVPFVVTSVGAGLARFDRRLEMAALGLGATPRGTFRQVTLPLIRPGVLVGALFAFITAFDELVVSLFLPGPMRSLCRAGCGYGSAVALGALVQAAIHQRPQRRINVYSVIGTVMARKLLAMIPKIVVRGACRDEG
jgi:ABC-type glycerol-3-phosphate transport system permease component